MRIFVVDDSVVFRRAISDALAAVPGVEVVGTAATGKLALSRLPALHPDLMTLDVEMPEMDGLMVLEQMQRLGLRTGVILVSGRTARAGALTIRALELGAFDFLAKPDSGTAEENVRRLREHLTPMIRAYERRRPAQASHPEASAGPSPGATHRNGEAGPAPAGFTRARGKHTPLVLIGVSTGGPQALATVVPALPANLGAPVLIVQHMPPLFTQPLAVSLAAKSHLRVKEAADGEKAECGCVYIAPGGRQMKLERGPLGEAVIRITDDPPENNCRPAVDYLFRSAALHFPGQSVAVILTGMGTDGTKGLRLLKRGGCPSIAQDQATSVVYGMPKEAVQAGLVDVVSPLSQVAGAIFKMVREAVA